MWCDCIRKELCSFSLEAHCYYPRKKTVCYNVNHVLRDSVITQTFHKHKKWLLSFSLSPVYKANDLGAFWPRLPDCGPGAGGSDWGAERHQKEIWDGAAIGQSIDQPLLQHGADAACTGRYLRWSQPEVTRTSGETPLSLCVFVLCIWSSEKNMKSCKIQVE